MSKADEATAPTEEQVKAANEAEEAKWQGDFDPETLKIPYKREDKEDGGAKTKAEDNGTGDTTDAGKDETSGKDSDGLSQEIYSEPAPVVTVEDPGEYKPADYSFEVTLADGKIKTIRTPEDADIIAEDPDNFETPAQLLTFIRKSQKMENQMEKDKEKWETQKKTFDEQSEEEKTRIETVDNFASEFEYLAEKGLIPKLSSALKNADWSDPEIAKDKDVKVYQNILDYLIRENKVREKAKVKPLTSVIDAFNAWKLDTGEQKKVADAKLAGETRKAAGAKVAGVSPSQQGTYVPKGIAVGNPNILKRGAAVWDD